MDEADWTDVEPVMEEEGEDAACTILYTEEYKRAMGYYRALLKSGEVSQRALNLTTEIIAYNPAHYSVWHFRRKVLLELGADLHEELSYLEEVILDNPKNYQVWHHREKVVEHLGDASAEMEFTKASLSDDAKNYHAWTFRQWAMEKYNLFSKLRDGGLGFVDDLLQAALHGAEKQQHIDEGIKLCERLKEVDSVRSRYWDLVSRQLSSS
ncbi:hypothetical protein PTSG_04176 [Salpingoeca rosetta]|uniref:Protein farnesyltransferase/geranylgeranyltransferase type-1 subunit alpha n=1 Tax=Salpingoeca rosetta (strain ATCC 50818 / BSB-021) TaxID=946362 RepID=F2U6T8_SALR5|nr:uncharacterized protein PTSG_04176 [Salpingoeca rosetta]EGD83570.1 hypothetical protein PTSG_04176 [Salpingoeca rosetta]|eukprot:XP_004995074.1 hypothetical protein PTSG_04176 [Salpingoeca rosetta]